MGSYREDASGVARETSWTFLRFLPAILLIVVVLSGVGFGLRSVGLIGGTIVEREVFEHSYQRSEALKARVAIDEAVLAEINSKLMNPNLDENTRFNLKAQASAARVRIATTRGQQ